MTSEDEPGYGRAWRDDWQQRLTARAQELGHRTAYAFTAAHPLATLRELVDALGFNDFAPIQLQWTILDGDDAAPSLPARARSLLIRYLRELPNGWPADSENMQEVHRVLSSWHAAIPDEYSETAWLVVSALLSNQDIAPHWLPSSIDDTCVAAAFSHWTQERSQP
jgi:hypothetical protein